MLGIVRVTLDLSDKLWIAAPTLDMSDIVQSDGNIMDSTMRTYATHVRYVVQYIAARDKWHISIMPMATTYLSSRCQHYKRTSAESQSEQSWQVLKSKAIKFTGM